MLPTARPIRNCGAPGQAELRIAQPSGQRNRQLRGIHQLAERHAQRGAPVDSLDNRQDRLQVGRAERSLELLGDAEGADADALRKRLVDLRRKYRLFGEIFSKILPSFEGPIDLEKLLSRVPVAVFNAIANLAKEALRSGK